MILRGLKGATRNMRCDQITEYLSAYIENDLEPGLRLNVDQHLETCDNCRGDLAALRGVFATLETPLLELEPPPHLLNNVVRQLRVAELEKRRTPAGWFASLSRGWQAATAGIGAVAVMAIVIALGPLHSGVTGGFGRLPGQTATAVSTPGAMSVAGSKRGFQVAGVPDDLLMDVSASHSGHWKIDARTSASITLTAGTPSETAGALTVWQGDLSAGEWQRIPIRLTAATPGAVHEITLTLMDDNPADANAVTVLLPVQTATATGALDWRSAPNTTVRQALSALAPLVGAPISVPSATLDQPVAVNMSGVQANDILEAVAAAASLKLDQSPTACNLHR